MSDLKIEISADLGNTLSAVDQLKAKLGQTKENIELLKEELKGMGQSLSANDKAIAKVNKELAGLNTKTSEGKKEAAGLRATLAQLAGTNQTLVTGIRSTRVELENEKAAMSGLSKELKVAEVSGNGFSKGLGRVFGAMQKVAYLVPGLGIAGLITLLSGPLVAGFESLIESLSKSKQALVDFTEFNKEAAESYGKEASLLQVLRASIENVNTPMATRLQGIKDLKKEFPGLFDGLSNEQLLTGNVAGAYDLATAAIIRKARATAAATEIEKIESQKLAIQIKQLKDEADTNDALRTAKAFKGSSQFGGAGSTTLKQERDVIAQQFRMRDGAAQKEINRLNEQEKVFLKIAAEGADRVIEVEEKKADKIKKIIEKTIKRRDYSPANLSIITSAQILIDAEQAQKEADEKLGKHPMKIRAQISFDILGSDKDNDATTEAKRKANEVEEVWLNHKKNLGSIISSVQTDVLSTLGEGIANALSGNGSIGDVFGDVFKVIGSGLQSMGKAMIAYGVGIDALKKAIKNPYAAIAAGVGLIIVGKLVQNAVPQFADGVKNFGGGLAVVGERGPELVRLPRGSDVIPNHQLNGMGAGGGAMEVFGRIEVDGTKLVTLIERATKKNSRNG